VAAFQQQTKRNFLIASGLATAAIALVLSVTLKTRAIQFLELGTYDVRMKLLAARYAKHEDKRKDEYVVIDIDNASFNQLKDKIGRWPWPREVWTEVTRWVSKGKPRVFGIDAVFSGNQSSEVDAEFAKVISKSGVVISSYVLVPHSEFRGDEEAEHKKFEVVAREARVANFGEHLERADTVPNVPLKEIGDASRGLGLINSRPDDDGAIRRVPIQFTLEGKTYPSMALRMAQVALGSDEVPTKDGRAMTFHGHRIPLDSEGRMVLLWRNGDMLLRHKDGDEKNKRVPLVQVICSMYAEQCPHYEQRRLTPDFFKDKVVLLGTSAAGIYDFHPTPLGEQSPGFLAHMNAVENLISGEAVTPTPRWVETLLIFAMTAAGAATLMALSSTLAGLGAALIAALAYIGISVLSFNSSHHYWLPIAAPMVGFVGAFLSTGLIRYQTTGRELRRTRGALNRYMSPQIVDYVLENVNLAGNRGELSILFSDVRSFTTMTEAAEPMELIRTLNEYLAEMTDVIFKYGGVCDKFIGDGILAYWGGITPGDNHAEQASRAALEMLERLKVLNEGWKAEGRKELAIGIGINTGHVIYGEVGAGRRKEFTVIGDPVNLAARLESQTKDFGVCLIVSEFTAAKLNGDFQLRPLGGVKVKGKTVETKIFELQSVREKAVARSH
jgi:adenylate cyclase